MHSKNVTDLCVAASIFVVCFAAPRSTVADGKFFHKVSIADEPGITAQRALVSFRDGVETLVVQSDVNAKGESFGWLLPLPANPTSIEAVPSNCLKPLDQLFRPNVVAGQSGMLIVSIVVFVAVFLMSIQQLWMQTAGENNRLKRGFAAICIFLGTIFACTIFLPILGRSRSINMGSASVLQSKRAGVYDVNVITGDTADAIDRWLQENGFRSHARANSVIRDYLKDGWCFLAAQVRSDATGEISHHPLCVTFPAKQPVYPMRLTGTDDTPLQLDLYVVADRQASAPNMKPWYCDRMEKQKNYLDDYYGVKYALSTPTIYRPDKYRYHSAAVPPVVSATMWHGCIFTRLHGRFEATDMKEDILIDQVEPQRGIATVHSASAAWKTSGAVGIFGGTLLCLLFAIRAERKKDTCLTFLTRRLGVIVLFAGAITLVVYQRYEVVPVEVTRVAPLARRVMTADHWNAIEQVDDQPNPSEFVAHYQAHLRNGIYMSDSFMTEENDLREPGDYIIKKSDDGWLLTFIDWPFTPVTVGFGADGRPLKTSIHGAKRDGDQIP